MAYRSARQCWYAHLVNLLLFKSNMLLPDADFDPSKAARDARKARVAKNERQQQQNLARAQQGTPSSSTAGPVQERKRDIDRTLATTRVSTASMGRFDRTLEGEKKPKGVKRKVCTGLIIAIIS